LGRIPFERQFSHVNLNSRRLASGLSARSLSAIS